jgi:hypothetical protein
MQNGETFLFFHVNIIGVIVIIVIIVQVNALLKTLELTESAQRKGHFALYNGLVATLRTMVCSVSTAICSLQNHSTAATNRTTF